MNEENFFNATTDCAKVSNKKYNIGFKPLGDRVVILPDKPKEGPTITPGGIELFESGPGKKITTGRIVAFAENIHRYIEENEVILGARVVYSPWSGFELKIGQVSYVILSSGEILGILTGKEQADVG